MRKFLISCCFLFVLLAVISIVGCVLQDCLLHSQVLPVTADPELQGTSFLLLTSLDACLGLGVGAMKEEAQY